MSLYSSLLWMLISYTCFMTKRDKEDEKTIVFIINTLGLILLPYFTAEFIKAIIELL